MATLPKAIYMFNAILNDIHHRDWKINPNVHFEWQMTVHSQANTEQNEQNVSFISQYGTSSYTKEL
jgi:hypothetical protein